MRNISLSTCGLVPKIKELAQKKLQLTLSVSLHAPINEMRSKMMPVNDAYPVEQLIAACREYQAITGRRISFEYSMVRGVNDSPATAKKLAGQHTNGDVEEAMDAAEAARTAYIGFVRSEAAHNVSKI